MNALRLLVAVAAVCALTAGARAEEKKAEPRRVRKKILGKRFVARVQNLRHDSEQVHAEVALDVGDRLNGDFQLPGQAVSAPEVERVSRHIG